jgi:hypothetical protein
MDELTQRLSVTESKTHSADLARLDKTIEDSELRLQYARMKIAEATSAGDGEALAKAQEMWYDSRKQVEDLRRFRETAATPKQQASIPDPKRAAFGCGLDGAQLLVQTRQPRYRQSDCQADRRISDFRGLGSNLRRLLGENLIVACNDIFLIVTINRKTRIHLDGVGRGIS